MRHNWYISEEQLSEEIKTEEWPYAEFAKIVKAEPHDYGNKYAYTKPLTDWYDCTQHDQDAVTLAREYLPTVNVSGQDLKEEKKSKTWGGMMYRVLVNKEKVEDSDRAVIQYIFAWSKQRLPFTLWNCVFPLGILLLLSLYINIDLIYLETIFPELIPRESIVDPNTRTWLIIILCCLYIIIGGYYFFYKLLWQGIPSVRLLFLGYGLGFLGLQYYYNFTPFDTYSTPFPILSLSEIKIHLDYPTLISLSFFVVLFIIILLFRFFELKIILTSGFMKRIAGTHKMDYAPIFVYLYSRSNESSLLENPRVEFLFDKTHYCIHREYESETHGTFVIKGRWHSFEYYKHEDWEKSVNLWKFFGIVFGISICGLLVALLLTLDLMWVILSSFSVSPGFDVLLHRLGYPALLFLSGYFITTQHSTPLLSETIKEDLGRKRYHLSPIKLLKMWNFAETKAQFTIKHKLQNPHEYISSKWLSFYNDEIEEEKGVHFLCNIGYRPQERKSFLRNVFRKKQIATKLVVTGEKLWDSDKDHLALNALDQAIQLDPENIQARTIQAQIYEEKKDIGKAREVLYVQAQIYEKKEDIIQADQIKKKIKELEEKLKANDITPE